MVGGSDVVLLGVYYSRVQPSVGSVVVGTCAFFSRIGRKKEQHLRAGKNASFRRYECFCTAIDFRGRKNELPGTFF